MSNGPASNGSVPRVRYDAAADAMSLRLREAAISDTVEIEESVYVDVDAHAHPLGIEFVVASDVLALLARREGEFALPERNESGAREAARFGSCLAPRR